MAYVERDDSDLDLNDEANFYEEDDIVYESESFGERIDRIQEEDQLDADDETVDSAETSPSSNNADNGFGEAISPKSEPDELGDDSQDSEGDDDTDNKDSMLKKAKGKLDEWTDKDQRE